MTVEQIKSDLKDAMKARNQLVVTTLRMVLADLKNRQIAQRTKETTVQDLLNTLTYQRKMRLQSIKAYEDNSRQDLADKEKAELQIIEKYLPSQMTPEEVTVLVDKAIANLAATGKDLGKVMGAVMPQVKGRFEGKDVRRIFQERIQVIG